LVGLFISFSGDLSPAVASEAPDLDEFVATFHPTPGYFSTYTTEDGGLYLEVTEEQFGDEFLIVTQFAKGNGSGFILTGFPILTEMFYFQKRFNKIELVSKNMNFRAEEGTIQGRMVGLGFSDSVRKSFSPAAQDLEDGRYLLDVTGSFIGDWPSMAGFLPGVYGTGFFLDKSRSSLDYVKGFERNVEIEVDLTFGATGFINSPNVPDPKTLPISLHYSILALPDEPMKPRLADNRLGFFTTPYFDYSSVGGPGLGTRIINRWRLEKKDPFAEISEPVKPIVYYLENTIPDELMPYVKEGVEIWNKAFEKAGFKNAILAMPQPNDPDWDPADARYSTIRWIPNTQNTFAIGPSDADPRTGEILNADILVVSDWFTSINNDREFLADNLISDFNTRDQLVQWAAMMNPNNVNLLCDYGSSMSGQIELMRQTLIQDGMLDSGADPIEYIGEALRELIAHEVGHTIGLRHNFKASTATPRERLHDVEFTKENGLAASVMDYNPPNISLDRSAQGEYFNSTVGTYDQWIIEWGYRQVGNETLNPHPELQEIAAKSYMTGYLYATDEETGTGPVAMDPYAIQYDMGSDPFNYYSDLTVLIDSLWEGLEDRILEDDEEFNRLRYAAHLLLFQRFRGFPWMAKAFGGVEVTRVHKGNDLNVSPFRPLTATEQRDALDVVLQIFKPGVLDTFPMELIDRMPPERYIDLASNYNFGNRFTYPVHDFMTAVRINVLNIAFNPERLMRVRDHAFRSDDLSPFTLAEMIEGFTNTIWADVMMGLAPRSSLQRETQSVYLDMLINLGSNAAISVGSSAQANEHGQYEPTGSHLPPNLAALNPFLNDTHALAFAELVDLHGAIAAVLAVGIADRTAEAFLMEAKNRIEQAININ
jgi:hypothetical protein